MIKWDYQRSELLIKMLYIFDYGIDMNIFSFKWVYYGEVKSNSFSKGVTVIIKFIYLSVCFRWKIGNLPKVRANARFVPSSMTTR